MWRLYTKYSISAVLLSFLLVSAFFAEKVAAFKPEQRTNLSVAPGRSIAAQTEAYHQVVMRTIPQLSGKEATALVRAKASVEPGPNAQLLKAAEVNKEAPASALPYSGPNQIYPAVQASPAPVGFAGLTRKCCQPPEIALATSPRWIVQALNLEIALYTPVGKLQHGWPKSLASFFGMPDPGSCAKAPFVSAPRAVYDPNSQRFWVVAVENEGLNNTCPFRSLVWVAVSESNNPNGSWHVYTFNMALDTKNSARFTQFALDQKALYFSVNMYSGKGAFQYAQLFASLKAPLEAGKPDIRYYGFVGQTVEGQPVDTVQPVMVYERPAAWLNAGLFVNSFNIRYGGGHCAKVCSGIVVWSLKNPGQANDVLTGVIVPSANYTLAPLANQPGCQRCMAQKSSPDTRISGTPIYHAGLLSFALATGVKNKRGVVPGIFWGQITPELSDDGKLLSAHMYQSGYFNYADDTAALYPALMTNSAGDLFMVYNYSGSKLYPGSAVVTRRTTYKPGRFHDASILHAGKVSTKNLYWGNYTAASYEGPDTDRLWFAGQYDQNQNWATYIIHD